MMTYEDMQKQIDQYNWDDVFEFVKNLLNEPLCDLALAIKIFYLGDGYGFFDKWKQLSKCLEYI